MPTSSAPSCRRRQRARASDRNPTAAFDARRLRRCSPEAAFKPQAAIPGSPKVTFPEFTRLKPALSSHIVLLGQNDADQARARRLVWGEERVTMVIGTRRRVKSWGGWSRDRHPHPWRRADRDHNGRRSGSAMNSPLPGCPMPTLRRSGDDAALVAGLAGAAGAPGACCAQVRPTALMLIDGRPPPRRMLEPCITSVPGAQPTRNGSMMVTQVASRSPAQTSDLGSRRRLITASRSRSCIATRSGSARWGRSRRRRPARG